jgi:hypothetical protein
MVFAGHELCIMCDLASGFMDDLQQFLSGNEKEEAGCLGS